MPSELTTRFPWEPVPVSETVALLQRDFAYAVRMTAVVVHSNRPELQICVNTARGQIVPRGECRFTDGSTIELHDIGMPQVGCSEMSVRELMDHVWNIARNLELTLDSL
jgi:hypothetical protein